MSIGGFGKLWHVPGGLGSHIRVGYAHTRERPEEVPSDPPLVDFDTAEAGSEG